MTADTVPSFSTYLGYRLKARAQKRSSISLTALQAFFLNAVRVILHLAGFSLLTWAGYQFNMIAGTITAGICCFVLSTLLLGNASTPAPADPMARR